MTEYLVKGRFAALTYLRSLILTGPQSLRKSRRGQTLVEYALILAVLSLVIVGVIVNLGHQVSGVYSSIDSVVSSAQASH